MDDLKKEFVDSRKLINYFCYKCSCKEFPDLSEIMREDTLAEKISKKVSKLFEDKKRIGFKID